jgi:hypothetical protein
VTIWIPDMSGFWMVNLCSKVKLSSFWIIGPSLDFYIYYIYIYVLKFKIFSFYKTVQLSRKSDRSSFWMVKTRLLSLPFDFRTSSVSGSQGSLQFSDLKLEIHQTIVSVIQGMIWIHTWHIFPYYALFNTIIVKVFNRSVFQILSIVHTSGARFIVDIFNV